MKRNRSQIVSWAQGCATFLALELLLVVCAERPAKAYVDPGSGALVWQGLLATLVGSAFYCRRVIRWVRIRIFKAREE
jgi:hypothetical protein